MKALSHLTVVVLLVTSINCSIASGLPAPLPEFKSGDQLLKLRNISQTKTTQEAKNVSAIFTGKPYDATRGTYLFAAREYDATTQRWTTSDPSGFPDGPNNWLYVNNNALNAFDPTGKQITLYSHQVSISGSNIPGGFANHAYIYYNVTDCQDHTIEGTVSGEPQGSIPFFWGNLVSDPNADMGSARDSAVNLDWSSAV